MSDRWDKLRREYISGDISLRALAEKHGVSPNSVMSASRNDHWKAQRDEYRKKLDSQALQKTLVYESDAQADLSATATRVMAKLMHRIEDTIDTMPEVNGTRSFQQDTVADRRAGTEKIKSIEYSIKDLTGAFKDIQRVMEEQRGTVGSTDDPVIALLKRWDEASGLPSESDAVGVLEES